MSGFKDEGLEQENDCTGNLGNEEKILYHDCGGSYLTVYIC